MSRISSFTDTIGLRSPHSRGEGSDGGVAAATEPEAGGDGFEEHANMTSSTTNNPAHTATGQRLHTLIMCPES